MSVVSAMKQTDAESRSEVKSEWISSKSGWSQNNEVCRRVMTEVKELSIWTWRELRSG